MSIVHCPSIVDNRSHERREQKAGEGEEGMRGKNIYGRDKRKTERRASVDVG